MPDNYKKFMTKSIWFTIGMFCLRCLLSQTKTIAEFSWYDVYGYAGEAIAFSVVVIILYEKWLWKINPFEKVPRLKRKYIGTLSTTYNGEQMERRVELEIHQTLLSVRVVLVTDESKSNSISASIDRIHDEWQLVYCYLNVPNVNVRERSEIHYGTTMLCIENPKEMKGEYYTDRKTRGNVNFKIEEKEKKGLKHFLLSPILHNVIGIIALSLLVVIVVLVNMIPIASIWIRILASCYVVVVIALVLILGLPRSETKIGFTRNTLISFIVWCVIIPVIVGLLFMVLVSKVLPSIAIDDIGFWSMAICITILSFIWFLTKLFKETDVTSYLDLYSTAWIALTTILTTLFDLKEKKGAFVFLLAMYLLLQILIKGKICRMQEQKNNND